MFNIVVYEKSNEVEVVPAAWICNGQCYWPPYKSADTARASMYAVRTIYTAPILQNLLTKQEIILDQLRTIILTLQGTGGLRHTTDVDVLEPETLPLHNLESLLDLEARLRSGSDLKQKLVSVIGPKLIRAPSINVVCMCVGVCFLAIGEFKKIDFMAHLIRNVLFKGAVRQNRLTSTASNMEVEVAIKRWLHLASDRDGGRKARDGRAGVAAHSHQF
uniref:DUF4806 domain-containing protein n=1 Tax=Monopterus albus TaxID=43700 RepID=A0A3Q3KAH7_MONAL